MRPIRSLATSVSERKRVQRTTRPKRRLKFGIASAITKLAVHNVAHIATQDPILLKLFWWMTSVPFQIRMYMYLHATLPFTTPATTIVGNAIPNAILRTVGDAEPRAGEATEGPA